jgi:hypothetical protein
MIYNGIPDATINVNSLNRSFLKSHFADIFFEEQLRNQPHWNHLGLGDVFDTNAIDLKVAIGAVAFFERHDIERSQLASVIAIST